MVKANDAVMNEACRMMGVGGRRVLLRSKICGPQMLHFRKPSHAPDTHVLFSVPTASGPASDTLLEGLVCVLDHEHCSKPDYWGSTVNKCHLCAGECGSSACKVSQLALAMAGMVWVFLCHLHDVEGLYSLMATVRLQTR